jgi:hypothetical protein
LRSAGGQSRRRTIPNQPVFRSKLDDLIEPSSALSGQSLGRELTSADVLHSLAAWQDLLAVIE